LEGGKKYGLRIFEDTPIGAFEDNKDGVMLTAGEHKLRAKKVIFATGYESQDFLKESLATLYSSFAFASEPLKPDLWLNKYVIWETARPYLYIRTSSDNRILVGGEDERMLTVTDSLLRKKVSALIDKSEKLLKVALKSEFAWAGVFGTTKDGLPYIGEHKNFPNAYFALCYDANGMVYGTIASRLLLDLYRGIKNPDSALFRFHR